MVIATYASLICILVGQKMLMGLIGLFLRNLLIAQPWSILFEDGIYAIGKVRSYRKEMPKLKEIRKCSGVNMVFIILKS